MKTVQPEIYEAARNKLRSWKLSDTQIDAIEHTGKIQNEFPILSNTTGIVTSLRVKVGDHVGEGDVLFEVTDLSHIWIVFDAYESDLPFLRVGDIISFTVQALPGRHFERPIAFIDPVLDASTRVVTLRAEMQNPHLQLKPGMFVSGTVKARLGNKSYSLVIPRSAVLWTGKRSIVYVRLPNTQNPAFKMREIILGPSLGDSYIVESGLSEGEEIVTEGAFTVDAAAQLAGKPSMLSPVDTRIEP
jgi:Cu(I)/Ag(I) efflux system membrane fusion protein